MGFWFQFICINLPDNWVDLIFYALKKEDIVPFIDKNQQNFFDLLFKRPILNILKHSNIKNIEDDKKSEFLENLVYKSMFAWTYNRMKELKEKEQKSKKQKNLDKAEEYKKSYNKETRKAFRELLMLEDIVSPNAKKGFFDPTKDEDDEIDPNSARGNFLAKYSNRELYKKYTYQEFLIGSALNEVLSIYRNYIICKNGNTKPLEKTIIECIRIKKICTTLESDLVKREKANKSNATKTAIKDVLRRQDRIIRDNNDPMSRQQYIKELKKWYKDTYNKPLKRESNQWWEDNVLY